MRSRLCRQQQHCRALPVTAREGGWKASAADLPAKAGQGCGGRQAGGRAVGGGLWQPFSDPATMETCWLRSEVGSALRVGAQRRRSVASADLEGVEQNIRQHRRCTPAHASLAHRGWQSKRRRIVLPGLHPSSNAERVAGRSVVLAAQVVKGVREVCERVPRKLRALLPGRTIFSVPFGC